PACGERAESVGGAYRRGGAPACSLIALALQRAFPYITRMAQPVSNILFDLGGVLLNLNYAEGLKNILPLCDPQRRVNSRQFFGLLARDPSMAEYERGAISAPEFFNRFVALTGFHGAFHQFRDIWLDIFSENQPMLAFARELAQRYDTYLCSNAGDMHFPWIYERFPALNFFKGDAVSCNLGAVKPNRAFYEKALAKFGLRPETCLFIDDRPENVESAVEFGIPSIQYTTAPETITAVSALLNGPAGSAAGAS
ncbi:MAG: HAD family phosphatase, partial [Kiritimatiellaeota bacterium]|nr:HAD family phosphatase [Kiritimatiellota bacterium]